MELHLHLHLHRAVVGLPLFHVIMVILLLRIERQKGVVSCHGYILVCDICNGDHPKEDLHGHLEVWGTLEQSISCWVGDGMQN